jgi:hypothetical protein
VGEQEGEAHPANVLVLAFHGGCEGKYRFLQVREKERERERERETWWAHTEGGTSLALRPPPGSPVRPVRLM